VSINVEYLPALTSNYISVKFPDFKLSDNYLGFCDEVKYLGHFISEQMTDDEDMYMHKQTLSHAGLVCVEGVEMSLFRACCTPLCTLVV